MESPPIRIIRHDSALGAWELARRPAHPALAPYVRELEGYTEQRMDASAARLQAPFPAVVVIVNFGKAYRVDGPGNREQRSRYGSFVSGLTEAPVVVESDDLSHCLQLNLTPIGAHLFFGMPMSEIANRAVGLEDVLGPLASRLVDQLEDVPDWEARFGIVESLIARRIVEAKPASPEVTRAWERLSQTRGSMSVQSLVEETGWSRKHLAAQFRAQIGLAPKSMARILRFSSALARINALNATERSKGWSEIALAAGYYDQAHFNREFREFTGCAPREYLRRVIPEGGVQA